MGAIRLVFFVWLFAVMCWIGNIYKLTQCDFKAPWKGEVVHAIGLMPLVNIVTVWNDDK